MRQAFLLGILTVALLAPLSAQTPGRTAPPPAPAAQPSQVRLSDSVVVQLLQESEGWSPSAVSAVVSAAVALLAVLLGPFVTIRVANKQIAASKAIALDQIDASRDIALRQIRASVVSANRQSWINALRDEIAGLDAHLMQVAAESGEDAKSEGFLEVLKSVIRSHARITLFLNPNEEDHQQLMRQIDAVSAVIETGDMARVTAAREELLKTAQSILKREWERVKRGD